MDDEVEIVEQNPTRVVTPFDVSRPGALRGERFLHRVRYCLNLPHILTCHDYEIIGETIGWTQVEHDDVGAFPILGSVDRTLYLSGKFSSGALAWRRHRTAATGAGI